MKIPPCIGNRIIYIVAAVVLLFGEDNMAWAVQAHGGAEGLVSHQIGHFLFISGMAFMLIRLQILRINGPGWFWFKFFLIFIIAWNLITFSGHCLYEFVDSAKFLKNGGQTIAFEALDFVDAFFYLTTLDHLFLVPSFICLLLALRQWRAAS